MKLLRHIVFTVLVAGTAIACDDSDPAEPDTGITIADLVGSWIATSDLHTNNADAGQTLDFVAAGAEIRITVLANGGARTWVEFGAFSDEWDAQITISGNTLTSTPAEAARGTTVWEIALGNGALTMTDPSSEFDFTLTGAAPVSTTEVVTLVRN